MAIKFLSTGTKRSGMFVHLRLTDSYGQHEFYYIPSVKQKQKREKGNEKAPQF